MLLHYHGKLKSICTDTFLVTLSTLQMTSGESISRVVSMQMVDILNTFWNKLMQTICIFTCFWFQWHLPKVSDFYCIDA